MLRRFNAWEQTFLWMCLLLFYGNVLMAQPAAKKQETSLKIGTLAPKTSIWGQLLRDLRKQVYISTRSQKQTIRMQVYYGGVQGDEFEVAKKIRYGQLDGGFFSGNGLGALCKSIRLLDLPFLFHSYEEADYVYERLMEDLRLLFGNEGFELVVLAPIGYVYFFSKQEIGSFDALQQTKMWIWKGDVLVHTAMKIMKIPAVSISFNQVTSALQTGLINTVYATPTALIALQWHKDLEIMSDLKINLVSGGMVLSKKAWQKLSRDNRVLMRSLSQQRLLGMMQQSRRSDDLAIKALSKQGLKRVSMGTDVKQIEGYGLQLKKELQGKLFSKALLQKVEGLIQQYRSQSK